MSRWLAAPMLALVLLAALWIRRDVSVTTRTSLEGSTAVAVQAPSGPSPQSGLHDAPTHRTGRLSAPARVRLEAAIASAKKARADLETARAIEPRPAGATSLALDNKTGSSEPWELRQIDLIGDLLGECHDLANDAAGHVVIGTVALRFTIRGEPGVGGLVSDAGFHEDGTSITESSFRECLLESVYALELESPPQGIEVSREITLRLDSDG